MLECNKIEFVPELLEQLKFFREWKDLNVKVNINSNGNAFIVVCDINGESFNYEWTHDFNSELEYVRYLKRFAKLGLYYSLVKATNTSLPWGGLTGIRPVKFAYQEGDGYYNFMSDVIGVSKPKMQLVERIMASQKGIYELNENNYDLFVGIPFCPSRCLYCSFMSSEIGKSSQVKEYVSALIREIESSKSLMKNGNLRSVYIGGGTPTSLPLNELERILIAVGKVDVEYTVEAGRPDCIDRNVLELLKKYNVSRICVNPQTFNDETLKLLGRKHTTEDIMQKFKLAKEYGFLINMDLIAGLPCEDYDMFKHSIESAIALKADNITVHTLSLKKGSKLKEMVDRLEPLDIEKMIDIANEKLTENGYNPYYLYRQKYTAGNLENTGYTLKGAECVYNIDIMEEITSNVACGANSVSKKLFLNENRIERYGAPKDIKTYIDKIDTIILKKAQLFD